MRFQELAELRVGVWGAGKEGCSIIRYLQNKFPGKPIILIDDKQPGRSLMDELSMHEHVEFKPPSEFDSGQIPVDIIIKSPGISRYRPEIEKAKSQGINITTATNLWLGEVGGQSRVIAVTGTKGKSTTSSILAFLLKKAGLDVALGGNIGIPLTDLLQQDPLPKIVVAELSSYQLSDLDAWPEIGIMLNLYPEHIDWHGTTEKYYQDKLNLFANKDECVPVLNYQDATLCKHTSHLHNVLYFNAPWNLHVENNRIMDGSQLILSGADLKIRGQHNLLNICAALTVVKYFGIDIHSVAGELSEFSGLPHRLEVLGQNDDGLTYVDDSLSTTPESAIAALESFAGHPITLLLGGKDREQDYKTLAKHLCRQQVHAIVTMHENGKRVADDIAREMKQLNCLPPTIICEKDLKDAVKKAQNITPRGGIVLLSPAAPSYDAYKNFQERGLLFRQLSCLN